VRDRGGVTVDDKPSAGLQRTKGTQRQRAAEPVEDDVHALAGELAHPREEVLGAVVDCHRAEPLDHGTVASGTGPVHPKLSHRPELADRGGHLPAAPCTSDPRRHASSGMSSTRAMPSGHPINPASFDQQKPHQVDCAEPDRLRDLAYEAKSRCRAFFTVAGRDLDEIPLTCELP
jgi:hypothetical protein